VLKAVAFNIAKLHQLLTAAHDLLELELVGGGAAIRQRLFALGKEGDDGGIDGVTFGQLAHAFGEVAHLAGVEHAYGNVVGMEAAHKSALVAAGGFHDDMRSGGKGPDDGGVAFRGM